MTRPEIINLKNAGSAETGFLTILSVQDDIPFEPQRIYWAYDSPEGRARGSHAHISDRQVLACIKGSVEVRLESVMGEVFEHTLDSPGKGLYIPGRHWRDITYGKDSILLVISSHKFADSDYIRDYEEFRAFRDERA